MAETKNSDDNALVVAGCLGVAVLIAAIAIHFFLGRMILHGALFVIAMTSLFFANRHYDGLEEEEKKRLEEVEIRQEAQKKEREQTIKHAAKEKIFNYLSDLRRASTRLEKKPESMPNVIMAMNEVIDRIIIDDEITREVVIDKKVNSQIELLKESLIKLGMEDTEIIKRIDSLKDEY